MLSCGGAGTHIALVIPSLQSRAHDSTSREHATDLILTCTNPEPNTILHDIVIPTLIATPYPLPPPPYPLTPNTKPPTPNPNPKPNLKFVTLLLTLILILTVTLSLIVTVTLP